VLSPFPLSSISFRFSSIPNPSDEYILLLITYSILPFLYADPANTLSFNTVICTDLFKSSIIIAF
jgi:hypothetical protein